MSKKLLSIYSLIDPTNNEIKYVGKCGGNLKVRMYQHMYGAKKGKTDKKSEWIRNLINNGLKPKVELIEKIEKDKALEREKYWISKLINDGIDLLNFQNDNRLGVNNYNNGRKRLTGKTDEELINSLIEFKRQFGDYPKSILGTNWKQPEDCYALGVASIATYINRFGSYVEACKMADRGQGIYEDGVYTQYSEDELIRLLLKFKDVYGFYPSVQNGNIWKKEIKDKVKEIGLPHYLTYLSRFGGITKAKELAKKMARN